MRVIHITRRRMALMSLALGLVIGSALLLAGCFGGDKETEVITAATNEERVAYLEALGWQVEPQPIETLDLQLPEKLEGEWDAYAKLQKGQGLPFSELQAGGEALYLHRYQLSGDPTGGAGQPVPVGRPDHRRRCDLHGTGRLPDGSCIPQGIRSQKKKGLTAFLFYVSTSITARSR